MELISWSEKYSVGNREIDNQHKGLVIIINELFSLMSKGQAKDSLNEIFDHLSDYTKKHFFTEESMMIKFAYPLYEQHKQEHLKFSENLEKMKAEFISGKVTLSLEVLNFLKDWLLNHILITDKKYSPHFTKMNTD